MSGGMGITHDSYDVYKAEEKYLLTEEKLNQLLKKYDGNEE